jgi:DNA-binding FrmR family transcriptional regulator
MSHASHKEHLSSIKRIEGQIRGIAKMIEDEKYCIDILNQIKAVRNSLTTVEGKIVKTHLKECVKDALKDKKNFDYKVEEVLKVIKR